VGYDYHPKDPRGKLREVVAKYLTAMRVAGREPNRGVVFVGDDAPAAPQTEGWLVDDRRPESAGDRYLLLNDGDVWRAKTHETSASAALDAAVDAWLAEPNDDLVTLLARSLADARRGGSGWLAPPESETVERVADRRGGCAPHQGPERRRG
jgi:hypothetical protein